MIRFLPVRAVFWFGAFLCAGAATGIRSEVIPPKPTTYFTDQAGIVSPTTAAGLNHKLAEFERETSNQLLVAIYPRLETASSIEDFTVRIAEQWKVGQKGRNNGAILFVFPQSHKMYIQVGYGLEGALPDAICSEIINREIKPRFQQGDYAGGLKAGTDALIAAAKGEYRGTGQTLHDRRGGGAAPAFPGILIFVLIMLVAGWFSRRRRGGFPPGNSGLGGGTWYGGGFGGGFGSSGGGTSRSDSFSSGGGSFGGGGAGGSW